MAEEWNVEFRPSYVGGHAWVTVTRNGETQTHDLGPSGEAMAAAMAWLDYDDIAPSPPPEVTLRDAADLLYYGDIGDHNDLAAQLLKIADGLQNDKQDIPAMI